MSDHKDTYRDHLYRAQTLLLSAATVIAESLWVGEAGIRSHHTMQIADIEEAVGALRRADAELPPEQADKTPRII